MTCHFCEAMAARTKTQLELRTKRIAAHPEIHVFVCPRCNSIEWATTAHFFDIAIDDPKRQKTLTHRLYDLAAILGRTRT